MNYAVFIQHKLGGFVCTVFKNIVEAEAHYSEALEHGARSGFITVVIEGTYNGDTYESSDLPLEMKLPQDLDEHLELMQKENE